MSNFGKSQLMKYGWTEGKGLGKEEDGIADPIKPKLKFDLKGVGHKSVDETWWQSVYNKASQNVSIDKDSSDSVTVTTVDKSAKIFSKNEDLVEIQKKHNSGYKEFIKTSTLENGKTVQENPTNDALDKKLEIGFNKLMISDEELFKACGGRTAHKGARHGLSLSGKLARIAKQEEELLLTSVPVESHKRIRTKKKSSEKETFPVEENAKEKEESTKKMERKEKKRKRKPIDTESEEDLVDEDEKEIAHLMNKNKSSESQLTKSQRKSSKRKINNLVEMLDKNFTLEENIKTEKEETIKQKCKKSSKKKKIDKQVIDLSGMVLQASISLSRDDDDYLTSFKDLTFKRYDSDPTKFCPNVRKKKCNKNAKKMDKLSDDLNKMCSLSEAAQKDEDFESKCRAICRYVGADFSKVNASKLNSKIEKKKIKRLMKMRMEVTKNEDEMKANKQNHRCKSTSYNKFREKAE